METLPIPHGTIVLDPFCGCGTTLTESQRHGIPSVGIDLNPIACLISKVKTSKMPIHLGGMAVEIVKEAKSVREPERPDIPNLDHWFKREIQDAVSALIQVIKKYTGDVSFDALRLALSSILVRISNQESDTRYAAIEKKIGREDVFINFQTACERFVKALAARDWQLTPTKVIESDILKVDPGNIGGQVGMVITSPPYPNAYEYWLYHKYRMWWLGFDPLAVKESEIGARAHFFKRDNHTEENFWEQMRGTFDLIDSVLIPSGWACFVIGRSKIHGKLVDNAEILKCIAKEHGMSLESDFERTIAPNRKSFNLSHAKIKTETILVFRKSI